MMIDSILGFAGNEAPAVSAGPFREDLRSMLVRLGEILATPLGPVLWAVGAALRAGAAPDHRERFWQTRFHQMLPFVDAAKARGELAANVDPEEIFAFAMGAVHYRMLVIGKRVDSKTVDQIVDDVCRLYCPAESSVEMQPAVSSAKV
jgi:hypothetical protein